jgi:hypothetical protein
MKESGNITREVFAESLKRVMKKTPFNRISVIDIVASSGYCRKTFYNYFQTKEELLIWIYNNDINKILGEFGSKDYSDFISRQLYHSTQNYDRYMEKRSWWWYDNRHFCRNAFTQDPSNALINHLYQKTFIFFHNTITLTLSRNGPSISDKEQCRLAEFFSYSGVHHMVQTISQLDEVITPDSIMHHGVADSMTILDVYLENLARAKGRHHSLLRKATTVMASRKTGL